MTEPAALASRSVILALQEITEDLVSADGGLAAETEDEAVEIVDMLLGHTDGASLTAPLLEDEGLALAAARRLLALLSEDPDTSPHCTAVGRPAHRRANGRRQGTRHFRSCSSIDRLMSKIGKRRCLERDRRRIMSIKRCQKVDVLENLRNIVFCTIW
ncbi:hypothetical protein [Streptomyces sp. NBC_01483]|uniref:hypothetical protein n=1 Tax=Streptomyces sp. NBC_01483 TaxID=2903883 RepID=UPI002E31C463|nr:hypothetical protein [Streptomyces sp. NBC_01483]